MFATTKAEIEFISLLSFLRLVSILTEKKFDRSNRNFVLMTRISHRNFVSSLEKWVTTIYHLACEISPTLEQLMHQNFAAFRGISVKFVFCDSEHIVTWFLIGGFNILGSTIHAFVWCFSPHFIRALAASCVLYNEQSPVKASFFVN